MKLILPSAVRRALFRMPKLYSFLLKVFRPDAFERRVYLGLILRGQTVVDIGANVGNLTMLFSGLVRANGQVYAFEPVPPTFKILSERISNEASYNNVIANSFACSDRSATVEIMVPGGDIGQASLTEHSEGSWKSGTVEKFLVQTRTLDDFFSEQGIRRIDFVKCDVEGAELLVLKGARNTLLRDEPIVLLEVAEFWTREFGYGPADIADMMLSLGYTDFLIDSEPVRGHELKVKLSAAAHRSVNLLSATPKSKGLLERLHLPAYAE